MMTLTDAADNIGAPVFWSNLYPDKSKFDDEDRVGFIEEVKQDQVRVKCMLPSGGSYISYLSPERLSIDPRVGFRPKPQRGKWMPSNV